MAEYDDIGNLMHRYVHGVGTDFPLIWYDGAAVSDATRLQLFANWQGSITTIIKGDESGEMVNINGVACPELVSGTPMASPMRPT